MKTVTCIMAFFSAFQVAAAVSSAFLQKSTLSQEVTPMEKVIELLKDLSADLEKESKAEAAQYDKYACFCKEQADNKLYAIEKSDEKIASLKSKMEKLDNEINVLSGEISDLADKVQKGEAAIAEATSVRKGEHESYSVADDNVTAAIDACERALEALKESKAGLSGDVHLDLVQLSTTAELMLGSSSLSDLSQKPTEYGYRSNDIIGTIENLRDQFIARKKDMDNVEFETNSMFEKKRLGLQNENQFATEAKTLKEAQHASKSDELSTTTDDKNKESAARQADHEFLTVVTQDCEEKATLFDQRTKTRADEITAITGAITALESKSAANFGANKKLVDLQTSNKSEAPSTGHWVWVKDSLQQVPVGSHRTAPSFLQQRSNGGGVQKLVAFLTQAATRLSSPALSSLALKVGASASEDHFVKVRGIIKDLVAKLKADAEAEATQKGYCDENMAKEMAARDTAAQKLEELEATLSQLAAEEESLTVDIATLQSEIAANSKALKEATELRFEEKATNAKTVADATEGLEGVKEALKILNDFYSSQGVFFQYVPPNSDREGNTVADLRPEIFDTEYKGKQKESKGVIGLLEILSSDFERTISTTEEEEALAEEEFLDFKKKTEDDTAAKEAEVTAKSTRLDEVKDEIVLTTDEKTETATTHQNALDSLETLKKMCVDGEETYEERVAARNKEIEALKEALVILDTWKGF